METITKYTPKQKTTNFQFRWNEPLGVAECPYAYRYVFIFFGFSIRIHKWLRRDDKRYLHNHGWWFLTFVLKGSYTDVSLPKIYQNDEVDKAIKEGRISRNDVEDREVLKRFTLKYRPANHLHYVEVPKEGCLTILITGRPLQKWGFWVDGKIKRPLKFFHKFGHPPCSEQ